jgi:hypothetical protein
MINNERVRGEHQHHWRGPQSQSIAGDSQAIFGIRYIYINRNN